jgi:hypothetical protein
MRHAKGTEGYPGPKLGRAQPANTAAQILCENSKVWATGAFDQSTLELRGSHIKAELGEFVEGN